MTPITARGARAEARTMPDGSHRVVLVLELEDGSKAELGIKRPGDLAEVVRVLDGCAETAWPSWQPLAPRSSTYFSGATVGMLLGATIAWTVALALERRRRRVLGARLELPGNEKR